MAINKQILKGSLLWLILMLLAPTSWAAIHDLGKFGKTYPIAERNALEEIKSRVAAVDWSKVFNLKNMERVIKNYRPDIINLPKAQTSETRLVDMTYTLGFDIPDGKGGILYPKGYTFNPLKYTRFTQTIVIINGDDSNQVAWFKSSKVAQQYNTMLLLTEGSYYDLEKLLKIPVFYATSDITERLQLKAVPSIARQKGKYMEITEIALQKNKN